MNDSTPATQCPRCGAALPPDSPEGLCPRCLAAMHFGPETDLTGEPKAAPLPPLSPEELAPHFPQLEILQCLGRGGMGVVYKTRQKSLNRFAALKLLAPERAKDGDFAMRFTREAHALAALNHPHIVTVYDFGCAGGFYFLLMEFVDGVTLRQAMNAKRFTPKQALAVVPPVCEALQYAHDHGIVHRDIKPENLLLDKEGRIKIADFGIAKILGDESNTGLAESQPAGTPQYMAPEQKDHQAADHRADIYSLGVVLYEMLTGELPGTKLQPPSRRVAVDVRIDEIVLRALEKNPEMRYATATEFRTQIEEATGEPAGRIAALKAQPAWPWKKLIVATFAVVVFSIMAAVLLIALPFVWPVLRQVKKKRPEELPARARIAEEVARARQLQGGAAVGESAAELAAEGWKLWEAGLGDEAVKRFTEVMRLAPTDANSWNGLGWVTLTFGDVDRAEVAFLQVLKLEPYHAGALNGLGQIYLSRREYDKAEPFLLKATRQEGASAAWFGLARLYLLEGKFEDAERWAQIVVDSGQGDPIATKMLKAAKEKRLSDGLRQTIEPPAPADKAESSANAELAGTPPPPPKTVTNPPKPIPDSGAATELSQQGWSLWQAGQFESAYLKFTEAARLAPEDTNAWNGVGWARFNVGKLHEAEAAFQKVISLDPNHPGALNGLGQIYLSRGEYDKAEAFLLKAAQQRASAAWFGLARLYLLQGKFEDAEKWAQMLVDTGQGGDTATKMLEAAKNKQLADGLRQMIEPPLPPDGTRVLEAPPK